MWILQDWEKKYDGVLSQCIKQLLDTAVKLQVQKIFHSAETESASFEQNFCSQHPSWY